MNGSESAIAVHLVLDRKKIKAFSPLLQKGVNVRIPAGQSIHRLLQAHLGLKPSYIQERIATVLLDGKPVDDLEGTSLEPASVLALSGAMPGLAGAALRKEGELKAFRLSVTHREKERSSSSQEGILVLKLFNVLMDELAPAVLEKGIYLPMREGKDFFQSLPKDFWEGCRKATIDGKEMHPEALKEIISKAPQQEVFLRVSVDPEKG